MPATILDAFGRPAEYLSTRSGVLFARDQADERLRPRQPNHFADYMALLGSWDWRSLVSESRAIGSRGLVAAALLQKADYVSASEWRPFFAGEDSAYGDQAEQLIEDTNHIVCTRGPRYDWATLWRLGILSVAADGAFFVLLTSSPEGWPLLQPLEAHRIGQRDNFGKLVVSGSAMTSIRDDSGEIVQISTPYEGLKIVDGIIYNRAGAEVAYRVLGPTAAEDEDVSARDMIHVGPPRWFSEGRPSPQIAPGLLSLLAVDLARQAQLDQQIIDSKMTLIETNETGRRDPIRDLVNPQVAATTAAGTTPDVLERGGIRYVKTGGSKMEAFSSARPSTQWMEFDERSAATAIAAIGWRLEMLDPTALRGAATRAFQDQINTQILGTFKSFRHAVQRCTRYRIAKYTQIGQLPDNPDFMRWGVAPPPEFVVDRNSALVDLQMVRAGADSMPNLHRRAGLLSDEVLNQQARWLYKQFMAAKKWSRDGLRITPEQLGNTSQRGDTSRITDIGTAVRAGAITPSEEIEQEVRTSLDLPKMSPETEGAWKASGGVRQPITLTPAPSSPDAATLAANGNAP